MGKPFSSGKNAFGFCDRCGQRYDLHDLNQQYENLPELNSDSSKN